MRILSLMTRRREDGFALFELVLAIALASLIGLWAASAWIRQVDDAAAQATGDWVLAVKKAMDQMLSRQSDLMAGIAGARLGAGAYADLWRPQISELIAAGHLPEGFALRPPIPYQVFIRVFDPVGDCAQAGCRIQALIQAQPTDTERTRAVDTSRLGHILAALAGSGASVHPLRPDRIKGANFDLPNPPRSDMTPLPAGSIAAVSLYDASQLSHLVRRDDRRDTSLAGQLNVKKGISSQAGLSTSAGVQAAGRVSAGEFLQMGGIATAAAGCDADGLIGRNTAGDLLTCHGGRWRVSDSRFGGVFSTHSTIGCHFKTWNATMINPVTGGCHCPVGFEPFQISRWKRPGDEYDEFMTYICIR